MIKAELKFIIKDFYDTMTYALPYEWIEGNRSIHKDVLELMLAINGEEDSFELCWDAVRDAVCIQTDSDALLLKSAKQNVPELNALVYEIKSSVLAKRKISALRSFDFDLMMLEVETDAQMGEIHACKLLAYVKWLREEDPKSRLVAPEIWKSLAMNGDEFSMKALIYAYGVLGDEKNKNHWSTVLRLLGEARDSFNPFISCERADSDSADFAASERTASLIMLIRRLSQSKKSECLDRPLLHYALYNSDSFETKLGRLTSGQDFYTLQLLNRKTGTRIGF